MLPISTIAFHPGAPGLTPTLGARQRAALASSAIFNVPIVKHLWSWLGLQSVDRRNMRCARALAHNFGGVRLPDEHTRRAALGPTPRQSLRPC